MDAATLEHGYLILPIHGPAHDLLNKFCAETKRVINWTWYGDPDDSHMTVNVSTDVVNLEACRYINHHLKEKK